jgi:cyclophilin family peptidyl-prolyl cis-trans isomerase
VVPGFVVQGGDPLGNGEGGPSYEFPDEFVPGLRHDRLGILSMANNGPDTNGSQFFITLGETNRLNYLHSVFGKLVQGLEILPSIRQGDQMRVKIRRLGEKAKRFPADQPAFDRLSTAIPRAAPLHFDDLDTLLPAKPPRAKSFNYNLENYQRFSGHKIFGRVYEKFQPTVESQSEEQFVEVLANKLELLDRGALFVCFATISRWHLWVGVKDRERFSESLATENFDAARKGVLRTNGKASRRGDYRR